MVNQPIPFKQHSTKPKEAGEEAQVADKPRPGTPRPPGEVGGHTVQPWEMDPVPATTAPNSKDVPPPEAGTQEAGQAGSRPGQATTPAPYNTPTRTTGTTATDTPPLSTNPPNTHDPDVSTGPQPASPAAGAGATRPPRPPVYSPQAGHEPAPRPPASHQPLGLGTDGDRLVAAITQAIAENIGKAFHQSVAQAVRDVLPLSGRSVDTGKPVAPAGAGKAGTPSPPPRKPATATAKPEAKAATPEAKPAAAPAADQEATAEAVEEPAAPSPDGGPEGPQRSQYGGIIEAPEGEAAKATADEGSPPA